MSIATYLAKLAQGLSAQGILGPSKGGTGVSGPGASGNLLISNGTAWVSQSGSAGPTGPAGTIGVNGTAGPTGPAGLVGSRNYTVTNNGASDYVIDGGNDPSITLLRGFTYTFTVTAAGHPFWIKTAQVIGTGTTYSTGVTNNGIESGTITFAVPYNAPSTLYYICQYHSGMSGTINITDVGPIGPTGPAGTAAANAAANTYFVNLFFGG